MSNEKNNQYFPADAVNSTEPVKFIDITTMTPEEIANIPGFDLLQDRIKVTVEHLTTDFQERIQETIDKKLDVLGFRFRNDKHKENFFVKRMGRAVDDNGINYIFLDPDTENEVLLVQFNPKTLEVL